MNQSCSRCSPRRTRVSIVFALWLLICVLVAGTAVHPAAAADQPGAVAPPERVEELARAPHLPVVVRTSLNALLTGVRARTGCRCDAGDAK